MGKSTKLKAVATRNVCQSKEEVEQALLDMGNAQRERTRIEADMNDQIAALKAKFELEAAPHKQIIETAFVGIQMWAESHRAELTKSGKTVTLQNGEIIWRMPPMKCTVRQEAEVVKALDDLMLSRFVRVKKEVNKEAALLEPEALKGVRGISFSQVENFAIKPFETALEEVKAAA